MHAGGDDGDEVGRQAKHTQFLQVSDRLRQLLDTVPLHVQHLQTPALPNGRRQPTHGVVCEPNVPQRLRAQLWGEGADLVVGHHQLLQSLQTAKGVWQRLELVLERVEHAKAAEGAHALGNTGDDVLGHVEELECFHLPDLLRHLVDLVVIQIQKAAATEVAHRQRKVLEVTPRELEVFQRRRQLVERERQLSHRHMLQVEDSEPVELHEMLVEGLHERLVDNVQLRERVSQR
mmetsp:Transcript_22915/g.73789  ORF Transcript_22915/g.73789 Transcript_22915/m.73789 type:complete len:233 (-) Transcript_22915:245-943(-)